MPRFITLLSGLALGLGLAGIAPGRASGQWLEVRVGDRPILDTAMVEAGRAVYEERCWFCHGEDGDGDGPVAPYLWPRPRDFLMASFKLRTTASGELPLDEDLYRTITRGIPGTSMPEWGSTLTEEERWQVIAYIKSFAADLFEDEVFDPYQQIVERGDPPRGGAEGILESGRRVFEEADCWECHGAAARGEGEKGPELTDDSDFPIWPTNLTRGWKFRGGNSVEDVYMRITTGLDGTPMPSYSETLSEEERWQVAQYVASLDPEGGGRNTEVVISALRVDGELPTELDDPAWEGAPEVSIPLTGQATFAPRWQVPAVTDISVQVLYNADEVALRLAWDDRLADTLAADSARAAKEGWSADDTYPVLYRDGFRARGFFPDAVEVMIPLRHGVSRVLPHMVYGSSGQPVDLWRWEADLQYDPDHPQPVTELRAGGTQHPPEAHALESQLATGAGDWQDGRWTVIIRRPLSTDHGAREVQLESGQIVPIAFHVWDGGNGETGLRMALSSWYFVYLREPIPLTSYFVVLLSVVIACVFQLGLVVWMRSRARRGLLLEYGVGSSEMSE